MDERLYLKGQRVITPEGKGEVSDVTGEEIEVKLDNGDTRSFHQDELEDDSNAG